MPSEQFANNGIGTLYGAISSTQLTLTISSNDTFPAVTTASGNFFYALIDSEILKVTDNSTLNWVIQRGNQSSIAATHAAGANVYCIVTKQTMLDIQAAAAAPGGITTSFGTYAARPAASTAGNLYYCTDSLYMFRDNGSSWDAFYQNRAVTIPPLVSSLTWHNQGGATANNNGGMLYLLGPGAAGENQRGLIKSYTAPKTLEIGFIADVSNVNYQRQGILTKAAAGAQLSAYDMDPAVGGFGFTNDKYSNSTTYNSTYFSYAIRPTTPIFMKFEDDNTNKKISISTDMGLNWNQLHSIVRTDYFTPDQFGIGININSNIRACGMTVIHWKEY